MKDKKLHAAQILMRHTFMNAHEAFRTTDCEINQIDWDKILDAEYSKEEWILVQILEFLLEDTCELDLQDLLTLNEDDLQAVMLSLSERFKATQLQENL
jgi:hypothetical protein